MTLCIERWGSTPVQCPPELEKIRKSIYPFTDYVKLACPEVLTPHGYLNDPAPVTMHEGDNVDYV